MGTSRSFGSAGQWNLSPHDVLYDLGGVSGKDYSPKQDVSSSTGWKGDIHSQVSFRC